MVKTLASVSKDPGSILGGDIRNSNRNFDLSYTNNFSLISFRILITYTGVATTVVKVISLYSLDL